MVLRHIPVDIHTALADREFAAAHRDLEPVGRLIGHTGATHDIDRFSPPPAVLEVYVLVPVGIEVDPPLLPQYALVMFLRVKSFTAVVTTHVRSPAD
ncbi:MAG: hypothetical protein E8D43_00925 [Nitrospira sp.]|nr:MAG: hypothetical protein E8D43_00925 [Nitrospira sp.]